VDEGVKTNVVSPDRAHPEIGDTKLSSVCSALQRREWISHCGRAVAVSNRVWRPHFTPTGGAGRPRTHALTHSS